MLLKKSSDNKLKARAFEKLRPTFQNLGQEHLGEIQSQSDCLELELYCKCAFLALSVA